MKMNYKKVGDTLSTDEYNALWYLLTQQTFTEEIELQLGTRSTGKLGSYAIQNSNNAITHNKNGYIITNANKEFTITIYHNYKDAQWTLKLHSIDSTTITDTLSDSSTIESKITPQDIIDQTSDTKTVTLPTKEHTYTVNAVSNTTTFIIKPEHMGLANGDYLTTNIEVGFKYEKPQLDYTSGRSIDADQILCENYRDMQRAISSSPSGSQIKLRLHGAKTYLFSQELVIKDDKTVVIEGGNPYTGSYAILNAQNICRHFNVQHDGKLILQNCKLINGNGTINPREMKGGSINMTATHQVKDDTYTLLYPEVYCDTCIFEENIAQRGGAIYNYFGNLQLDNCTFNRNNAISDSNTGACWGGAIFNLSEQGYNDSSNQLVLDKGTLHGTGTNTHFELTFKTGQNVNFFKDSDFELPDMYVVYKGEKYLVRNVSDVNRDNKFECQYWGQVSIDAGDTFYMVVKDFDKMPCLCTRLMKRVGNMVVLA